MTHASPSSNAFDKISDEILASILFQAVYTGGEFADDIEYGHTHPWTTFPTKLGCAFTVVDKRFYQVAIEVLWRNIVVIDDDSLEKVSELAPKLGRHTWRFELHLPGAYESALVPKVLASMSHLRVFLLRNIPSVNNINVYMQPDSVINALCQHCPSVRRIQFDSDTELPEEEQLRRLFNENIQLVALRSASLCPVTNDPPGGWTPSALSKLDHFRYLSVGREHWTKSTMYTDQAIDSFFRMLTATKSLRVLARLDILEWANRITPFLRQYGHQLETLVLSVPDISEDSTRLDPCSLQLCPNATEVTWLIKNCSEADMTGCVPQQHASLALATIDCANLGQSHDPDFPTCVHYVLECLQKGDFPQLKKIKVLLRGHGSNIIADSQWIRRLCKELAVSGIQTSVKVM